MGLGIVAGLERGFGESGKLAQSFSLVPIEPLPSLELGLGHRRPISPKCGVPADHLSPILVARAARTTRGCLAPETSPVSAIPVYLVVAGQKAAALPRIEVSSGCATTCAIQSCTPRS